MTVFAYLISDDLQDIYIYIKKKKEPWAMGAEQPHWPFPDLVLGKDSEDARESFAGKSLEGRNHKLENPGPAC